jgi:hypothetical protein
MKKRKTIYSLCAAAMTMCGLVLGAAPASASIHNTPGYVHLMNAGSEKCIDATDAGAVQWRCLNTTLEEWQFQDVGSGVLYQIVNSNNGECLTAEDINVNGAMVFEAACSPEDNIAKSQAWVLSNRGTNSFGPYFSLVNMAFKGCLDLENGDTSDGVPMQIWACNPNTNNQRWQQR